MTTTPGSGTGNATTTASGRTEATSGRFGATLLVASAVWMAIGGINQGVLGVDYWSALEDDTLARTLSEAGEREVQLQTTHVMWAVGMLGFVVALTLIRRFLRSVADHPLLDVGYHVVVMGATFNVVSYIAMAAVTTTYAGAEDITGAEGLLRLALRLDDYATLLMLGFGPVLLSLSGRGSWAPRWLLVLSSVALVANLGFVTTAFVGGAAIALAPAVMIGVVAMITIGIRVRALAARDRPTA